MWRVAVVAAGLIVVTPSEADIPAEDVYRVRWESLKGAAATLGGEQGAFIADVEGETERKGEGTEPGMLLFRPPNGFTGPLNQLLLANLAAGRKERVEAFLDAVNEGGWITGRLIAREGGDYAVSVACRGEFGKDFVVEYTHSYSDGRKATHSHHVRVPGPGATEGGMAWVTGAEEIKIEDHWVGYGPASPAMADYTLRRDGKDFVGMAAFSAGGHFRPKAKKDSCDVRVPADAMAGFLAALAGCSSREAEYKPGIHHTDDYPDVRITVKAAAKSAAFWTKSQGEFHEPWAIEQDGETRVVTGDAPGRALKALEPHLARTRFDALVKEVVGGEKGAGL